MCGNFGQRTPAKTNSISSVSSFNPEMTTNVTDRSNSACVCIGFSPKLNENLNDILYINTLTKGSSKRLDGKPHSVFVFVAQIVQRDKPSQITRHCVSPTSFGYPYRPTKTSKINQPSSNITCGISVLTTSGRVERSEKPLEILSVDVTAVSSLRSVPNGSCETVCIVAAQIYCKHLNDMKSS